MSTNTQVVPFNFNSLEVRTVIRDGEPWFVAVDVCTALGYKNTSKAIGDHLDADEKANESLGLAGSPVNIINESGLYALVLRSRKPEARKFAKWVTAEVLPAIRQTGTYTAPQVGAGGTALPEIERPIDVRALLLDGQSTPTVPLPRELQSAINQRAWSMAHEAYELCREHLARRVAHRAEWNQPREIDRETALAAIAEGTLNTALAQSYYRELHMIGHHAQRALEEATEFVAKVRHLRQA